MATRSHTWFDAEKLLPGEELVRSGSAQLRIDTPPYWWEGVLVLTSDRLFFLPHVHNPFLDRTAFWLRDLLDHAPAGRNRLHVRTHDEAALLHILDASPRAVVGAAASTWLRLIRQQMRVARPASAFTSTTDSPVRRRAAG